MPITVSGGANDRSTLTNDLRKLTVQEDGDTQADIEARALLNKFLGATALMTSIESNSGLSKEFLSSGSKSSPSRNNKNVSRK